MRQGFKKNLKDTIQRSLEADDLSKSKKEVFLVLKVLEWGLEELGCLFKWKSYQKELWNCESSYIHKWK